MFSIVPYMMTTPLRAYVVSDWAIVLLLALAPAIWLLRTLKPHAPGCCRHCGYDLRGTPDRCPECGTQATQAKPQPAKVAAA
jgi:predicted amidophosphoribosyltransferase